MWSWLILSFGYCDRTRLIKPQIILNNTLNLYKSNHLDKVSVLVSPKAVSTLFHNTYFKFFQSHPQITETFRFCLMVYLYNMFHPQLAVFRYYWNKLSKCFFLLDLPKRTSTHRNAGMFKAGVTFDNSFFDNYFDFVRQLKNGSFLVRSNRTKFSWSK